MESAVITPALTLLFGVDIRYAIGATWYPLSRHRLVPPQHMSVTASRIRYRGRDITSDFDLAVEWIHATAPDRGGAMPGLATAIQRPQ